MKSNIGILSPFFLFIVNSCTTVRCVSHSKATTMGVCEEHRFEGHFGEEIFFDCESPTESGRIGHSGQPIMTGQNLCTEYRGE